MPNADQAPVIKTDLPLAKAVEPFDAFADAFHGSCRFTTFTLQERGAIPEIESISICERLGLVVITSRKALYLLDSSEVASTGTLRERGRIENLFFSTASINPGGEFIAVEMSNFDHQGFKIYATKSIGFRANSAVTTVKMSGGSDIFSWSPDGSYLAVGGSNGKTTLFDVSNLATGESPREIQTIKRGFSFGGQNSVRSIDFTPDSRAIVICYEDGIFRFASLRSQNRDGRIVPSPEAVAPDALHADTDGGFSRASLPALRGEDAWWKNMLTRRSWLGARNNGSQNSLDMESFRGALSPDGKILAAAGSKPPSMLECFTGSFIQGDKWLHPSSVRLFDLSKCDRRNRPVPREIARFDLNQTIHSLLYLPDGEHLIIATQSCGCDELSVSGGTEHNIWRAAPGVDPELYAQVKLLKIERSSDRVSLREVGNLLSDSTDVHAAIGAQAKTFCIGENKLSLSEEPRAQVQILQRA